jgi:hypothetical protein
MLAGHALGHTNRLARLWSGLTSARLLPQRMQLACLVWLAQAAAQRRRELRAAESEPNSSSGTEPRLTGPGPLLRLRGAALLFLGAQLGSVNVQEADLFAAVLDGNLQKVNGVLARKPELVHARSTLGATALHLAVTKHNDAIVRRLLEGGAEVDVQSSQGISALHCASMVGSLGCCKLLLQHGAATSLTTVDNALTPLHGAAVQGSCAVLQLLLSSGASVRETTTNGWTALHVACNAGKLDAAKLLLTLGAEMDARVLSLRRPGALVQHPDGELGYAPEPSRQEGRSALELAANRGFGDIVRMFQDFTASLAVVTEPRQVEAAAPRMSECVDSLTGPEEEVPRGVVRTRTAGALSRSLDAQVEPPHDSSPAVVEGSTPLGAARSGNSELLGLLQTQPRLAAPARDEWPVVPVHQPRIAPGRAYSRMTEAE